MKTSSVKFPQIKEFLQSTTRAELQFTQGFDKFISFGTLVSFFLLFVQALFLLLVYRTLPSVLPLLYSLPGGEGQLVQKQIMWALPGLTCVLLLVNLYLSKKIDPGVSKIMAKLFAINNLAVSLILSITLFKIITS